MGDISPCVRCGIKPVRRRMGGMTMVQCRRLGGCGTYVYSRTREEAERLWNESNPPPAAHPQDTKRPESDGGTT